MKTETFLVARQCRNNAETAKANNLKPYAYFEYLLSEIPNHMDDKDMGFLESLLPWSEQLPEHCRK